MEELIVKKMIWIVLCTMELSATKYGLGSDRTVVETFPRSANTDPDWWVNSGAYFKISGNVGSTVQGELPSTDRFYNLYKQSSFVDTDGGLHPQNLFRLVTNKTWVNCTETVYFRINRVNLSTSPNRNQSNGVLFFLRYGDGDHLYYAGIRVDGDSVIKKKNGNVATGYTTMDERHVYQATGGYNATIPERSNFIPTNTWIGLRAEIQTLENNAVSIRLWVDKQAVNHWEMIAEATDNGNVDGSSPFLAAGFGGIRTDFMDVDFHSMDVRNFDGPRPVNIRKK